MSEPCAHIWRFVGGCNCDCHDYGCSVPVHECERCGVSDYGQNHDADDKRRRCKGKFSPSRETPEDGR